jgi:hypothetical protein
MSKSTRVGRDKQSSWAQKMAIVEWLEIPENFKLITGSIAFNSTVVAGKKTKKLDGYKSLGDYVNEKCGSNWNVKTTQARYRSYIKLFKKTLKEYRDVTGTKFCIGPSDIRRGVTTIDQKLEYQCYGFKRLDALFSVRQNVTPHSVYQPGQNFADDDDDDDDASSSSSSSVINRTFQQVMADTETNFCSTQLTNLDDFIHEDQSLVDYTSPPGRQPLPPATLANPSPKGRKTPILLTNDMVNLCSKSVSGSEISDGDNSRLAKKKKTADFNSIFQDTNRQKLELENSKFEFQCKVYGEEFMLKKMDSDNNHANNQRDFHLKQLEYDFRQKEHHTMKELREYEINSQALLAKELKQMDIVKEMRLELMKAKMSPEQINEFIAQMFGTTTPP